MIDGATLERGMSTFASEHARRGNLAVPSGAKVENDHVVEIRNVSIEYASVGRKHVPVRAVDDVSVSIKRGEKFIILGPSGCGKSTLLMSMGGFISISSGSIMVNGKEVSAPSMERIMVFQDFFQLLPWRTVLENVAWGIKKRWPKLSRAEILTRARTQVDLVGLNNQAEQYPSTLSGGQKQRCAIARSFAATPEILLMDEPFGALDAISREKMQAELNNIWERQATPTTIAFVTHDVNEAVLLGHRIMVMTQGPGRIREIVSNPFMGRPLDDEGAMRLAASLRELLKEEV